MLGGCYKEVVYDNMRNVVTRFIGKNEKELNEDLIKLSIYYGFEINVTNCFSGNEKGYVESSVKILRNQIFATDYKFSSLSHAQEYLTSSLIKFNENSKIEEEKCCLLPYKPKLELAEISLNLVNSYSFVSVENNFYSVPEYLVGKEVTVKKYYDELHIYSNTEKVCVHKRLTGAKLMQVDIMHYLNTFLKKPGAVRNSKALKSIPELHSIYVDYYSKKPRKFIETLSENKDLELPELVQVLREKALNKVELSAIEIIPSNTKIDLATRSQTARYVGLSIGGANS